MKESLAALRDLQEALSKEAKDKNITEQDLLNELKEYGKNCGKKELKKLHTIDRNCKDTLNTCKEREDPYLFRVFHVRVKIILRWYYPY
ncbi:hypothetical protein [Ferviditalea candida]|uniref:Uncharacterized protein n=1 Tax=Ferviditalea candida TaxID=3108399 RepID=A0ABU5ZGX3_9BACL|nr:hypothetical protein [Paenibacillaceae bacterium T2]